MWTALSLSAHVQTRARTLSQQESRRAERTTTNSQRRVVCGADKNSASVHSLMAPLSQPSSEQWSRVFSAAFLKRRVPSKKSGNCLPVDLPLRIVQNWFGRVKNQIARYGKSMAA